MVLEAVGSAPSVAAAVTVAAARSSVGLWLDPARGARARPGLGPLRDNCCSGRG